MHHQINHRLAVATNGDRLAGAFDLAEELGELSLGIINTHNRPHGNGTSDFLGDGQSQHPALYLGPSTINGEGLFASVGIPAGQVIVVWNGFVATAAEVERNWAEPRYRNCSQIGADQFLVPHTAGAADHVNHSCHPNCGIRGTHTLVAMRDIPAAEEITYDYAMTDGCDYDVFDCACQSAPCRRRITGSDWRKPVLQAAYRGWFSEHIADLIARDRAPWH